MRCTWTISFRVFLGVALSSAYGVSVAGAQPAGAEVDLDDLFGNQAGETTDLGAEAAGEDLGPASSEDRTADRDRTEDRDRMRARAPRRRVIEEVVVTAQRREEGLRDVPISMSVIDADFVKEQNITDFKELARFTPNATINNQGIFEDIRIRGFGTGLANKSFEQSVGMVIDNTPFGRSSYAIGPMFDVERVEVLRGPQGVLFGKNTTAGLINVTTGSPSEDLTASVSIDYGELNRIRVEPAVGGPVIPGLLHFRIAGLFEERDGTVVNTTAQFKTNLPSRSAGRDRKGIRAKLQFPDVLGVDTTLSYEHTEYEVNGAGWEGRHVVPAHLNLFRLYDPKYDAVPGNHIGGSSGAVVASFEGGVGGDFTRHEIDTFNLTSHYDVGDWGLDFHASYSNLTVHINSDAEFTPSPAFGGFSADDNPQIVAELRTSSPSLPGLLGLDNILGFSLGSSELTAGFFFQDRRIENSELGFSISPADVGALLVASGVPNAGLVTTSPILPPIFPPVPAGLPIGDVLTIFRNLVLQPEISDMFFEQKNLAYAGFGNVSWQLLPRWGVDVGLRYTFEDKSATLNRVNSPNTVLMSALSFEEFFREIDFTETAVTPRAVLRFDWSDDLGFYASYSRGFKGGGASEAATNARDESLLRFEPEIADAYEVGAKALFLEGTATINMALFWQDVTDYQVFTIDQDISLNVRNAGAARSRGVEVDGLWLPTDWLTLRGVLGFNDAEFLDFKDGTCAFHRLNIDGDDNPRCDLSGKPPPRTPPWQTNLGALVQYPVPQLLGAWAPGALSTVEIQGGFSLEYMDHFFASEALEGKGRQSSFFRLNANIGVADSAKGLSLRLFGTNLTDVDTVAVVRDMSFGGQTYLQVPHDPRLFFGTFQWRF